ncbi:MAG: hypothetical protein OXG74_02605 [Acidobacteria bacterium]|nr:hypothetical protein [Acidobacteriota bacterium]
MTTIGKPGSRADLLLTLARLALPDAVRRSRQPLAVAIFVAVLFLAFATVATLGLLPAIFAIESDALQRNILSLIAILSLVWIFGRTAAITSILANRSVEGTLGALAARGRELLLDDPGEGPPMESSLL